MDNVYPFTNPDAEDFASEQDRKWFEAHPKEHQLIRPAYDGEMGGAAVMIRVTQIAPGIRSRELLADV